MEKKLEEPDISEHMRLQLERNLINEIAQAITSTYNLDQLLKLIHESLNKVIYAENCFVTLYDQNTGLFSFPYWIDKINSQPEQAIIKKSLTAYVFRTGSPLLLGKENFKQLKEQNEVELIGSPSPSWVGIPLRTPEGIIGVLVLHHHEEENIYSERDLQFLDSVGNLIALAIERKLAEENLQKERLLLRAVIDNIPDSIYCKDIYSKKIFANVMEVKLSGASSESELLGKTDFEVYPKEIAEGFFADDQYVMQTGQSIINREEFLFDDKGQKQWLLTSKIPLKDNDGNIIGLVGIGRNISIRKQVELALIKREEELLNTNAEKDKFFSIIAHDLKSPFQGLLGLTEDIANGDEDFTKEELLQNSKDLYEIASTLYKLLENLLEWAQMQKGSIKFSPQSLNVNQTVSQNVSIIKQRAVQKGIAISNEVPESIFVTADEKMLNSVLRNILSNSVKFTKREGRIIVNAKLLENAMVEISISDTGIGIPDKDVKRLFKMNEKVSSVGTEGESSSGLGLLLCKEFVEKNGGRIWVESQKGVGSTFYFTIPQ